MAGGPCEDMIDVTVGRCAYGKFFSNCNFFPCEMHGNAEHDAGIDSPEGTKNDSQESSFEKLWAEKRLKQVTEETLVKIDQIASKDLDYTYVLDSASSINATDDRRHLLSGTIKPCHIPVRTGNGYFVCKEYGQAVLYCFETRRMLHIMKKYVLPRIKVRALLSEGILDQLGCTIVSKDGTRVVYDKANKTRAIPRKDEVHD